MKPFIRILPRDGDAEKVVVRFFSQSGQPATERLVMLSNCERILSKNGRKELMYQVNKTIREFNRERALGYWP